MSQSKAPRRPGGRRPVPPLIFLLILAILALAVWWKVIRKDEARSIAASATCTLSASQDQIAQLTNMGNIKVHVLNGSAQKGLAASIQTELAGRGFTVLDIGNAGGGGQPGAGKIEYGKGSEFQAAVLQAHLTGFEVDRSNQITDGSLTVIAGQEFAGLADANQAGTTVKGLVDKQARIVAGCPSEAPKSS
ncbi:LytR C-terminal domain-containing protein [Cumulibacter manganitolerans]|uniref:LytR C-terminal domain-containing protein n=1 Tax=Cumulibacter manganitolerans TaxID=1884992 RepID=UPI001297A498|nr:LytR C-terminal domain-containing protein [Cumulibacter manganitolerans]